MPSGYLDDGLFGDGAGPALAGIESLFDGEAAAMGLEPFHQQVVDSSKVVVAFVLQRLEDDRVFNWSDYRGTPSTLGDLSVTALAICSDNSLIIPMWKWVTVTEIKKYK